MIQVLASRDSMRGDEGRLDRPARVEEVVKVVKYEIMEWVAYRVTRALCPSQPSTCRETLGPSRRVLWTVGRSELYYTRLNNLGAKREREREREKERERERERKRERSGLLKMRDGVRSASVTFIKRMSMTRLRSSLTVHFARKPPYSRVGSAVKVHRKSREPLPLRKVHVTRFHCRPMQAPESSPQALSPKYPRNRLPVPNSPVRLHQLALSR